jgi:hypothetical protein
MLFSTGILSSQIRHLELFLIGGTLEDRPHYNTKQFVLTFPLPDPPDPKAKGLGENTSTPPQSASNRQIPEVTITAMYAFWKKLRKGEHLDDKTKPSTKKPSSPPSTNKSMTNSI